MVEVLLFFYTFEEENLFHQKCEDFLEQFEHLFQLTFDTLFTLWNLFPSFKLTKKIADKNGANDNSQDLVERVPRDVVWWTLRK